MLVAYDEAELEGITLKPAAIDGLRIPLSQTMGACESHHQ